MLGQNVTTVEGRRFWAAVEASARAAQTMPAVIALEPAVAPDPGDWPNNYDAEDDLRHKCAFCVGTGVVARANQIVDCEHCGGVGRVW